MLALTTPEAAIIGALLALWLGAAVWALATGLRLRRSAQEAELRCSRLHALIGSAPALIVLVHADGALEGSERLADWLGLDEQPATLGALCGPGRGLWESDLSALEDDIRLAQSTGKSFHRTIRPQQSKRNFTVRGGPAPAGVAESGTAILYLFDATEVRTEIARLSDEADRLAKAFDALSGLIEASPIPMWHRGPDLKLTLVNSAYVKAVEAEDAADVITRGVELVEAAPGRNPIAAAAAARESGLMSSRVLPATVGGERRSLSVVDVPLGNAGVAGYAIDVEELEQARLAFRRFADAQRDLLDRLSAGVAQFAADRSLSFYNQAFMRLFAIKPEWLSEGPEFDRVLERMRETGRLPEVRDFRAWRDERRGWFTAADEGQEENWMLPGGVHLRVVAQPLPDGGLLLIFEDRTEQVALASARDTLLRVRAATFDNLFEAVGVFAADGRLQLWNQKFRDVWDLDEAFLSKHPRVDQLAEAAGRQLANPSRAAVIRELVRVATQDRKQRSGRVALKNGRHFEFAAVPLPDGNALFTMLDISDSRRIEAALRDRNEALEDADRVKTAFVANMSYELRTPLTSIGGFAEMLAGGYAGELAPTADEYVRAILDSVARLSTLIDHVLDLTQSEAGGLPLEKKSVDVRRIVREAAKATDAAASEKSIEFTVEIEKTLGTMNGDARRIRQVLDNLLANAIRFTPPGGQILLRGEGYEETVRIVISDSGPGMTSKEQARAFDRFSRSTDEGERGSSLGLGLPLARQFVEAHGGSLTLASEPGQGTAVTVELPRK
ncbi:putative two-component histidine kinase [Sphingomonas changbaiensis NBRC 104936]|uniref:histidine kinase n=1 Tax=Sphingomonas changbaiensis NBRC 104936 TaxID=1219043 RepID=A0A0E9MP48_9SPHN|nr:PAS domain-containing sensor histidine kinase [Sphingomonas changbaiensis]GAO38870.1 putative two-component histidine kinase [Sphingomonas changbaiensis NBRC 104936]